MMSTGSRDTFAELKSDWWGKVIVVVITVTVETCGNLLILGLLWYERYGRDQSRTLINRLFHWFYFYIFLGNIFLLSFDSVLFLFELTFSREVCLLKDTFSTTLLISGFLFSNEMILVRYLYTCVWKNVGIVDHGFLTIFLNCFNLIMALHVVVGEGYFMGHRSAHFYICTGQNWSEVEASPFSKRSSFGSLMAIFTMNIHLAVFFRMFIFNWAFEKTSHVVPFAANFRQQRRHFSVFWSLVHQKSLVTLGHSFVTLIGFGVSLIPVGMIPNFHEEDATQMNLSPTRYWFTIAYFWPYAFTSILIPCWYFYKTSHARETLWRNLKDDVLLTCTR